VSEEEIVKALTNAMPHDILVNTNWTLYKDTKAKDIEIKRLNNIINELEKKLLELRLTDVDGKTIVYRLLNKLQELKGSEKSEL
jgi:transcriptional regulator NrdR family protein